MKEWEIVYDDEVKAAMDSDPKIAAMIREMTARMRQATADYEAGRYNSLDAAMEAIGATKVEPD